MGKIQKHTFEQRTAEITKIYQSLTGIVSRIMLFLSGKASNRIENKLTSLEGKADKQIGKMEELKGRTDEQMDLLTEIRDGINVLAGRPPRRHRLRLFEAGQGIYPNKYILNTDFAL